jgi:hypothetical protein
MCIGTTDDLLRGILVVEQGGWSFVSFDDWFWLFLGFGDVYTFVSAEVIIRGPCVSIDREIPYVHQSIHRFRYGMGQYD